MPPVHPTEVSATCPSPDGDKTCLNPTTTASICGLYWFEDEDGSNGPTEHSCAEAGHHHLPRDGDTRQSARAEGNTEQQSRSIIWFSNDNGSIMLSYLPECDLQAFHYWTAMQRKDDQLKNPSSGLTIQELSIEDPAFASALETTSKVGVIHDKEVHSVASIEWRSLASFSNPIQYVLWRVKLSQNDTADPPCDQDKQGTSESKAAQEEAVLRIYD